MPELWRCRVRAAAAAQRGLPRRHHPAGEWPVSSPQHGRSDLAAVIGAHNWPCCQPEARGRMIVWTGGLRARPNWLDSAACGRPAPPETQPPGLLGRRSRANLPARRGAHVSQPPVSWVCAQPAVSVRAAHPPSAEQVRAGQRQSTTQLTGAAPGSQVTGRTRSRRHMLPAACSGYCVMPPAVQATSGSQPGPCERATWSPRIAAGQARAWAARPAHQSRRPEQGDACRLLQGGEGATRAAAWGCRAARATPTSGPGPRRTRRRPQPGGASSWWPTCRRRCCELPVCCRARA